MKRYLWILLAVLTLVVGCQPNTPEGGEDPIEEYITSGLEGDAIYFGYEASESTIYVDSHDSFWEYSYDENQEWCIVSDISEDGLRVLVVAVEANETGQDRELVVTLTNGEKATQFTVNQSASDSTPAQTITPAQKLYVVDKEVCTVDVAVAADGEYEVEIPNDIDWIELDATEEIEGGRKESFYIHGNFGEESRTAVVTLSSKTTSVEFTIKQWGSKDVMVSTNELTLPFYAGSDTLHLEVNADYTMSLEGDWLTYEQIDNLVVFNYGRNDNDSEEREATFTISTANNTEVVSIVQARQQITEMPESDIWQEDILVPITAITASSQMSSRGIDKAYDDKTTTSWFTETNNDAPQEIVITFDASSSESIDYIYYLPVSGSMEWGRWGEVEVYATDVDGVESLVCSTDLKCSASPGEINFDEPLAPTTKSLRVVIKNGSPFIASDNTENKYVASATEIKLYQRDASKFSPLSIFTDMSLSEIRSDVTLADIEAIRDPFYRSLAEKIFHGIYDSEFRVCEFRAYPSPDRDAATLRDKEFGVLDNVTGMYVAEAKTPQYIYLDEDYGQAIYVRVVDYVNNESACCASPNSHSNDYRIYKGRNVITPKTRGLMYILVFTDDYANIPVMKAHFINSKVNGYLCPAKHNPEDVQRIFTLASQEEELRFDMVFETAVLNFEKIQYYRGTFKNDLKNNAQGMYDLQEAYDTIMRIQERIMGLNKYRALGLPRHHRNRMLYTASYRGMVGYSGSYRIGFAADGPTMVDPIQQWRKKAIAFSNDVVGSVWCLAHELGHSTQTDLFDWCGLTEVTNNLMCAIAQNELYGEGLGRTTMRYNDHFNKGMKNIAARWAWDFDEEGNWYERPFTHCEAVNSPELGKVSGDVDPTTRLMPFYQLYLYYHLVKNNRDFYPDFYEQCRVKDIKRSQYSSNDAYHSAMMMEFVKTISEVSGENLSHWADRWGLPGVNEEKGVNRGMKVNHYDQIYFKTTAEDVAAIKEYCSKYPTPELDLFYLHDLNIELYRNPQKAVAGTHTVDDNGNFRMEGWQNVAAWLLVDPDKTDENGEQGRVVAVIQCSNSNGADQFRYGHIETRYIPKDAAKGDYSDYWYNEGSSYASSKKGTQRGLEPLSADYQYTKSLQLYAVDVYGNRYASGSNTR